MSILRLPFLQEVPSFVKLRRMVGALAPGAAARGVRRRHPLRPAVGAAEARLIRHADRLLRGEKRFRRQRLAQLNRKPLIQLRL